MTSNALRWYGLAAVVVGVLFTVSDFVALLVSTLDDPGEEVLTDAYAGWAALSLFTLALLQVALIGLYVPQEGTTGTLGWVGFLLAFIGTSITFLVVLIYAIVASPMTPADPELLEAGPPGPFILYFPLFCLGWFLLGAAFLRSSVYPRPAALRLKNLVTRLRWDKPVIRRLLRPVLPPLRNRMLELIRTFQTVSLRLSEKGRSGVWTVGLAGIRTPK